ncbi:SMP-30/gluconolactonase/LRE family protein [Marinoscillum sp.]|uniref:SMP-30/gluconolactonase/LRE family protein n=1 Tax=Marinoscillum sp. TaxID=2024838 RepID=UPI003BA8E4D0
MMKTYSALCIAVSTMVMACTPSPKSEDSESTRSPSFETTGSIERLSPELDLLIPVEAKIEVLASGFTWSEGPLWLKDQHALIFSDVPENTVYKWTEQDSISIYLKPSGYDGDRTDKHEPGANGLALDNEGNLILCQHGNRQLAKMVTTLNTPKSAFQPVTSTFNGKRYNSPNDVVISSDGAYYFTDPPYGLDEWDEKELEHNGVYRMGPDGQVSLLIDSLTRPNGIALSPDEKTLYVAVSDPKMAKYYAYDLDSKGSITDGRVLLDVTDMVGSERKGLPDGLKVDKSGNLFATGPGGVLVISPEGKHLGTILTGQATANCGFNADKSILYMTAHSHLMRITLKP